LKISEFIRQNPTTSETLNRDDHSFYYYYRICLYSILFQKENIQIIHSTMEIYKYVLLFFAGYIAVCATFSKIGLPLPICFDSIFGSRIAFVMRYVIFFGFVWWAGREIYNRYIKKEGLATKASTFANAMTENEQGDQSDKNTIYDKFLKNAVDIPDVPCDETKLSPIEKKRREKLKKETGGNDVDSKDEMCKGDFKDIPSGYYGITITSKNAAGNIITEKKMMPVKYMPEGCKLSGMVDKGIVPISPSGNFEKDQEKCRDKFVTYGSGKQITYDADNLDKYATNIEKTGSEKEELQKNFDVNLDRIKPPPIYYEPGSYTFGATGYIPDYERSIYLSKTTNLSQVDDITVGVPYLEGGFCTQYANSPQNMEQKCQSLDNQTCATTSCCVLLGGQKCVSGDSQGPKIRNNYSDTQIVNRDYYYYQGKCFGNCDPNSSTRVKPSSTPTSTSQWGNQTGAAYAVSKGESITGSSSSRKPKTNKKSSGSNSGSGSSGSGSESSGSGSGSGSSGSGSGSGSSGSGSGSGSSGSGSGSASSGSGSASSESTN